MTAREHFHACIRERRKHKRGSLDWDYFTRAARQYLCIVRGVAVNEWSMK